MNVSFLANTELNLSSLVSEEGEVVSFRAKVRENPCFVSFVGMFFFFLLTANHVWFLGIFQQTSPLNLVNLSILLPSSFPCAARSFPCFLTALCPLTLAHLGLRPLQLVGTHHGL